MTIAATFSFPSATARNTFLTAFNAVEGREFVADSKVDATAERLTFGQFTLACNLALRLDGELAGVSDLKSGL